MNPTSTAPSVTDSLLQSQERFRLLIENSKQYVFIVLNVDGVVQSWDGGAEELLQYTKEEAIGKTSSIFFTDHDIERGEDKKEMDNARRHGYAEDERWHVRKDGSCFWGSGILVPMYHEGTHIGYGKIFRDRTHHTAVEQRKDDFVGITGHELRNPLSVLKTNIELIMLMPEVSNNRALSAIHNNMSDQVNRLTHLVDDLLDLSKIASGQLKPQHKRIDLKHLIAKVGYDFQTIAPSHTIALVYGEEAEIYADPDQITQVLNNLISNAIKYSPTSDRIEISLYNHEAHVEVQVRDFGMGIPDAEKKKIFDRFYRIETNKRITSGLGIGLYVCYEIIKAHGGAMGVESELGKGSSFYFTLPK